ncbi:MAG: hypothetical protein AB1295_02255 [Candidatus Micrarchaeota archaeon]
MAVRRELMLILALVIVIAVLVKVVEFFRADVVEADASKFVLEDLRSRYPNAEIGIMTITPKNNPSGERYFEVKAKVTKYAESACPERSHIFYNYPAQNFVAQPAEVITSGCQVCTEGICTIAFPEEAIIASHTLLGTEEVERFIQYNDDAEPSVYEKEDSWTVKWDSLSGYVIVNLHRNGSILGVESNPP